MSSFLSRDDFDAAQRAGFRFLLARWGYGAPGVEEKNGPVEGMGRIEEIGEFSWYMKILE
jgi:hypothetical protein